ncbi:hypothetical protein B0H19DRAFT_1259019 [Mycena capillaripes]|nr:hypothetical protein B0H19DRAFT_1259019 [Mycena capillaripes]
MFTFVTHLDLLDYIPFATDHHLALYPPFIALLPVLTHLAMRNRLREQAAVEKQILVSCRGLEALIIPVPLEGRTAQYLSIEDVRFVYMVVQYHEDDWVIGASGGMDFWARADAFIAKRRRGEIEPSSRCWIEEGDGI